MTTATPLSADGSVSARVDEVRRDVSPRLEVGRRSKLGQYMTSATVAADMAAMFSEFPEHVRLLEAGAGMGALVAAFITEALGRERRPRSIAVTAFEVDPELAGILRETLEDCRAACQESHVGFEAEVIEDDYILRAAEPLFATGGRFNVALLNPPYAKLNTGSQWRKALRSVGIETVNLYSAFVALATDQLEPGGELVAITPRSFCNGPYYEPFRRHLLRRTELLRLHVFESRKKAFKDDDVLQENVIYQLRRGTAQPATVRLETDGGQSRDVPFEEIVQPEDPHCFIRLTVSTADAELAERVQALPCRLKDLGVSVSTGRIVDFRAKSSLRRDPSEDTAPLIYPAHLREAAVRWPIPNFKKHNAIQINEHTERHLVPPGRYLLAKRFSSKEEKRRLVVSVYDAPAPAAFENHLNYFHCENAGLSHELALGLAAFLNSTAVDDYFRLFSGHTQVNAADLRNLHFPSRERLEELGRLAPVGQVAIDEAVAAIL
jgi:adenine-specific DNA-methyltransferase